MDIRRRHWMVAVIAAVVVHAGAAAAVLWQSPPSGAKSAGMGGIEVALGPAGGAPGDIAAEVSEVEEVEAEVPPEAMPVQAPEPEAVEPVDTVETPVETETAAAEPTAEQARPVEAESIQTAEAVPVLTPPPPQRKPVPPPEATPAAPAPVAEAKPAPEPAKEVAPPQETAAEPSAPGAGGKSGSQARPDAGNTVAHASSGGMPGHAAGYLAALQAWLERHKEYPARARSRRQEGTVLLFFAMDREGRVHETHIQRGSGHSLLDQEALALIRRAEPLPPPPPEFGDEEIRLVVPMQFFLR